MSRADLAGIFVDSFSVAVHCWLGLIEVERWYSDYWLVWLISAADFVDNRLEHKSSTVLLANYFVDNRVRTD